MTDLQGPDTTNDLRGVPRAAGRSATAAPPYHLHRLERGLIIAMLLLTPAAAYAILVHPEELLDWIESVGPWAGVIVILLMIAHNFVPVPAEMIAVCAGAVLGPIQGVLTVWTGAMLGAAIAFWIARRYGRGLVERYVPPRHLLRVDRYAHYQGGLGLLALRLIPVISFNLINYAAGLTKVSWFIFLWTTAVGILPVTVISVAAGANLHLLDTGPLVPVLLVSIAVVLVFARGIGHLRHRSTTKP